MEENKKKLEENFTKLKKVEELLSKDKQNGDLKLIAEAKQTASTTSTAESWSSQVNLDEDKQNSGNKRKLPKLSFEIGDRVSLKREGEDEIYAVVESKDAKGKEVTLRNLADGSFLKSNVDSLSKLLKFKNSLTFVSRSQLTQLVGKIVLARFSDDGKFYKAVLTEILSHSAARVSYVEYDTKEVLPLEYLGYLENAKKSHYEIKETDTEVVKQRKKKMMKSLKKKSKIALKEEESQERQKNWQKFRESTGLKTSIFRVPEVGGVMSGKVGVTNSGKGVTDFRNTRVRHKFK
eukprot:maker-scaffold_56-snap-gene-1.78-mRNA-1 protein AED:0.17 eAED:0.25 QI:0/0/0.5/1/0/0/2/137/291